MGRLRGKRNRDQDRYWSEQRRAEQFGMVGASDVSLCCFCGQIVVSDEAGYTPADELFCRKCGHERGLIQAIKPKSIDVLHALLQGEMVKATDNKRGSRTLLDCSLLHRRDPSTERARVLGRALLWAQRVKPPCVVNRLLTTDELRVLSSKYQLLVYLQKHPRRQHELPRKLTDAQVETIRVRYASGTESFKRLGAEFGVAGATISLVVTGCIYKHAGGPIHIPHPDRTNYWGHGVVGCVVRSWGTDGMAKAGLGRASA